jgi:hypothetical protein
MEHGEEGDSVPEMVDEDSGYTEVEKRTKLSRLQESLSHDITMSGVMSNLFPVLLLKICG